MCKYLLFKQTHRFTYMFVFQRTVLTVPRSGWERRKEAVKTFPEERKAAAAPCTSQEFPLLAGTLQGAGTPGSPYLGAGVGASAAPAPLVFPRRAVLPKLLQHPKLSAPETDLSLAIHHPLLQ